MGAHHQIQGIQGLENPALHELNQKFRGQGWSISPRVVLAIRQVREGEGLGSSPLSLGPASFGLGPAPSASAPPPQPRPRPLSLGSPPLQDALAVCLPLLRAGGEAASQTLQVYQEQPDHQVPGEAPPWPAEGWAACS